ncbi:MAG: fructose-2,6-bisphosphatase [Bacilli bacterium]|nr:fructose-2,6-bisphosphatase [Bacilli bacterium]
MPIKVEFDLHEWTPDNWKAIGIDEIKELLKDYMKHNGIYPSGESKVWESKESILNRIRNVLHRYLDKSKVMVICHGMVIATLFELNSEEVEFCGIFEYEIT